MIRIRRPLLVLCLLSAVGSGSRASSAPAEGEPTRVASELQRLIRERLGAYENRDVAKWARYVDETCVCAGSNRAALQQEILARPAAVKNGYGEIRDFTVRLHGEVAVARYRITEFTEIGSQRIELDLWRTETYLHRDSTWKLIAGADVLNPHDPQIAKVDPRLFDAYVGRYEYTPGLVDTVTREGDRLFVQSTGMEKEELLAENDTTFFAPGQDWRVIFLRNEKGEVTSLAFRQNGQDLVARRMR